MELLCANKNFKYLGLAPHLCGVPKMIMSYDDDTYDKFTEDMLLHFCMWYYVVSIEDTELGDVIKLQNC